MTVIKSCWSSSKSMQWIYTLQSIKKIIIHNYKHTTETIGHKSTVRCTKGFRHNANKTSKHAKGKPRKTESHPSCD